MENILYYLYLEKIIDQALELIKIRNYTKWV